MKHPTLKTGEFDISGWHFERWEPANDEEVHECWIIAQRDESRIVKVVILMHPNLFGLDVEDAEEINQAVEEIITELGLEDPGEPRNGD